MPKIRKTDKAKASKSTAKPSKEKSQEPSEKKKELKCRVWEVQSHIDKGIVDDKFTPEHVERYLQENESEIKRWCWVLHDKDHYSEDDVNENAERNNGVATISVSAPKPAHIHLALEFRNPKTLHALAKEIGIEERQIQKSKAKRNHFMAIASYLTHEDWKQQDKGKYRYPDSEIHHSADFDYRKEVDRYFRDRNNNYTSMKSSNINDIINRLESGEIPNLEWIKQRYGYAFFLENEAKFIKAHREFIKRHYEMLPRINYIIEGPSGYGKSTLAEMLARCLYPDLSPDDAFFSTGEDGVAFDDYAYQPVIIWDDVRSDQFKKKGAGEILNLLEIHPKKRNYNIKYGGVILINQVNIFTSTQTYKEFLDGISDKEKSDGSGEKEDKKQFYRRVPIVLSVRPNYIDVLINEGAFGKTRDCINYSHKYRIPLNIKSANMYLSGSALVSLFGEALSPVIQKHNEFIDRNKSIAKLKEEIDVNAFRALEEERSLGEIFNVQAIDASELSYLSEEEEQKQYEEYLEDWKENHNGDTSAAYNKDKWILYGRPKSESSEWEDSYNQHVKNIRVATFINNCDVSCVDSWLQEAYDDQRKHLSETTTTEKLPNSESEDEIMSEEDFDNFIWLQNTIIDLNLACNRIKYIKSSAISNDNVVSEPDDTKFISSKEAFEECIHILMYHYDTLYYQPVVDRIKTAGRKAGFLAEEQTLDAYINEKLKTPNLFRQKNEGDS